MEQQRFVRKNKAMFDAAKRQEQKRARRTVFYVLLLIIISLIFLLVCAFVFLKVDEIKITGNERYSEEQIMELVPIMYEDNIYSFDAKEIEEAILKKYPYVASVEITRDLPSTVDIKITEEEPYYSSTIAGDTYLLSSGLKVLDCIPNTTSKDFELTEIKLGNIRRCLVGSNVEFISMREFNALTVLYETFENNYITDKIISIDFSSRFDISFNYDNRFEVYVGDVDNVDIKMKFFVAILDELEPESTGKIDISNSQEAAVSLD